MSNNPDMPEGMIIFHFQPIDWKNMIIKETLQELEPSLNLHSSDMKILKLCSDDYRDFYECIKRLAKNCGIMGNDNRILNKKEIEEAREFIKIWVTSWWKKYKERVQIRFKELPEIIQQRTSRARPHIQAFTNEERIKILNGLTREFIKCGEVCGARLLAGAVFQGYLAMYYSQKKWSQEDKFRAFFDMKRKVKELARQKGALIFIKPDTRYYRME